MNLTTFNAQLHHELTNNILAFHIKHSLDRDNGGFYGRLSNSNHPDPQAHKGQIQHSRLLWSFAHAYRRLGDNQYLQMAKHAASFLGHFWDEENGGLWFEVNAAGQPSSSTKFTYGHAFGIYGYAEYFLATGDEAALDTAIALHTVLQERAKDNEYGGYFEAFKANWVRDKAQNIDQAAGPVGKTMNTHLHLLEAYTILYLARPYPAIRTCLRELIELTLEHIIAGNRFQLHFTDAWEPLHDKCSYGHDIEGSWLLVEAAEALGEPLLLARCQETAVLMAESVLANGRFPDGSIRENKRQIAREWWPQAEALVGFYQAYALTGDGRFLDALLACWRFIQAFQVDQKRGEWFWAVDEIGQPWPKEKAGQWKTPYHSGRACLELLHRIENRGVTSRVMSNPKRKAQTLQTPKASGRFARPP